MGSLSICTGPCLLPPAETSLGSLFSTECLSCRTSKYPGWEPCPLRPNQLVCFFVSSPTELSPELFPEITRKWTCLQNSALKFIREAISVFIMKPFVSTAPECYPSLGAWSYRAAPQLSSEGDPLFHSQAVMRKTIALALREVPRNGERGEEITLTLFNLELWNTWAEMKLEVHRGTFSFFSGGNWGRR